MAKTLMKNTDSIHTPSTASGSAESSNLGKTAEIEVDVEPLESDYHLPVISPERRLSWLGWTMALGIFLVNKKLGIIFIILLIIFGKYPTLNLRNLSGKAGRLYKRLRS